MKMRDTDGFFRLIYLCIGVMAVFALIANMTKFGVSGPLWVGENSVTSMIAPLVLVICFIGIAVYVVVNR